MRKIRTALAVAAVTVTAGTLLTSPAQAAPDRVAGPNCASLYRSHQNDGYVRAYDAVDCYEQLGAAQGDDGNWNDAAGPFRKLTNDKATSLLNTGTYSKRRQQRHVLRGREPRGRAGVPCLGRAVRRRPTGQRPQTGEYIDEREQRDQLPPLDVGVHQPLDLTARPGS